MTQYVEERHRKKLDFFYDVKRQMYDVINKRKNLEKKVGMKLVHCKLKGRQDIADDFKRLILMKSAGAYYATKEAQMMTLIRKEQSIPSKSVQQRVECLESEIFGLLALDSESILEDSFTSLTVPNCVATLQNYFDNFVIHVGQLGRLQELLAESETYTEEGFRKRDVETKVELEKNVQEKELELEESNKQLRSLEADLDEYKSQFQQEEEKVEALKEAIEDRRAILAEFKKDNNDVTKEVSGKREHRNGLICQIVAQKKALGEDFEDQDVKTSESLHNIKTEIENEIAKKTKVLNDLKNTVEELDIEERSISNKEKSRNDRLNQIKEENRLIDDKISGAEESDVRFKRDIESCLDEMEKDVDADCTLWRNRAIRNILQGGMLDINQIRNVAYSNVDKYKFPLEQYQIYQALKTEIAMLNCGISDMESRVEILKTEMISIDSKTKNVTKQRSVKENEYAKLSVWAKKGNQRTARLEKLLTECRNTISGQLNTLLQLIPNTDMLRTIDEKRRVLLIPILPELNATPVNNEEIEKFNKMKRKILETPKSVDAAIAYQFLKNDLKFQMDLQRKLDFQLSQFEKLLAQES